MRTSLCASMLVALTGCRPARCEPEIHDGTLDERADVAGKLRTFYDLLRPDLDLCITDVTLVDELDAHGRIDGRKIELLSNGPLFHELCHGVQHQNDLPTDAYEPTPGTAWDDALWDDKANELFAGMCSFGPRFSWFLRETCPGDPDLSLYWEGMNLFLGFDSGFVEVDPGVDVVVTVAVETSAEAFEILLADDAVVLELGDEVVGVDPWTGEEVVVTGDVHPMPVGGELASGGTLFSFRYDTETGDVAWRWLLDRKGHWSSVGCLGPAHQAFVWDGELWTAALEAGVVTISRWDFLG